jgi:hypothetical protein
MDVITWLMNEGTVLDGTVIANIVFLAIIIELFGICSYWLRRF